MKSFPAIWFFAAVFIFALAACSSLGSQPPAASDIPTLQPSIIEKRESLTPPGGGQPGATGPAPTAILSTPAPQSITATQSLSQSLSPTPAPCTPDRCVEPGRFWLARPIAPPGRVFVDPTYRFGSTQNGVRETHHGVEFVNSSGTPVLAAAAGEVVVAGTDETEIFADWPFFYGNLVVLEHQLPEVEGSIFTLYGHLSVVAVAVGDQVAPGQQIGEVGLSGVATGSHLHFEVRLGENRYAAAQNPELWLIPEQDEDGVPYGVLAGRIEDGAGRPIYIPNLVVERLPDPGGEPLWQQYLETYVDPELIGMGAQEENFALGDLPAGWYRLTFVHRGLQVREVYVAAGQLTRVTFTIDD